MISLVVVLGLLYLCLFATLVQQLYAERAENRRLRQENSRLMIVMGERRGIQPPPGTATYRTHQPLEPAGPSAFRARHQD
jgi:hypothetical protein